ncbi:hypothetical protein [Phenylobacterium sp.]|uniref:hypothetical protein n=1 Tax=Phenylobacterium sp. TaxID=1871053 RepID=UPI0025E6C2A6|nr:hypothetical protein [Phenylobacterium sp.]
MAYPKPEPGLVIRYSFLWREQADRGQDEGEKDRPCAIVMTAQGDQGDTVVIVLPVTHTPPVVPISPSRFQRPRRLVSDWTISRPG